MLIQRPKLVRPRGLWLPSGTPQIDWSNPLTAGLVGCWIVTGEGGSTPIIRDYVSNSVLTAIGSPSIISNPNGRAAYNNAGANGWSGVPTATQQTPTSTAVSILWFGVDIGVSAISQWDPIFACYNIPANGSSGIAYGFAHPENANLRFLFSTTSIVVGGFPPVNIPYCLLGTYRYNGNYYLYANGLLKTSGAASTPTPATWTSPSIRVNLAPDNASYNTSKMYLALVWTRQLSMGESALITSDPTNFLLFPGDAIRTFPSNNSPALYKTNFADSIVPTEQYNETGLLSNGLADNVVVSDNYVSFAITQSFWADTIVPAEQLNANAQLPSSWFDNIGPTEQYSGFGQLTATYADNIAATDQYNNADLYVGNWSDSSAIMDQFSETTNALGNLLDTESTIDHYVGSLNVLGIVSDIIVPTENYGSSSNLQGQWIDLEPASDVYQSRTMALLLVSDTISYYDTSHARTFTLGDLIDILPSTRILNVEPNTRNLNVLPTTRLLEVSASSRSFRVLPSVRNITIGPDT